MRLQLWSIVEDEIAKYVNDDFLCNDLEGMFPQRHFLTGEWYVSEIYFDRFDYLSVYTALLGTDLGYKDDYLGLEVILYYEKDAESFCFVTINSEAL